MDNDKSILDKITDTVKGITTLAADAASQALKAEEPPLKADEKAMAYGCRRFCLRWLDGDTDSGGSLAKKETRRVKTDGQES